MPVFETPRLIVRPLSHPDLPALTAILSDPQVMQYSIRGVCDEQATAQFIDWCLGCYASHGMGPWALEDKASAELVGFCGVAPETVAGVEEAGLGYRLATRYWNRGLASEAARGVIDHVFAAGQVESLVAIIEPAHGASLRVAEKVGFSEFEALEFHARPVRLYRLQRQAWSR